MKELVDLYNAAGKEFLNNLFKYYVVVSEKISGTSMSFEKKSARTIVFYKGNRETKISKIERTLVKYYEEPIEYLESVFENIENEIPENWVFCLQYFSEGTPSVVEYKEKPKNGLILTHIQIYDGNKLIKIIEDPRVLKDWGEMLDISYSTPIFQGKLSSEQKEKIKDFLDVPKEEQLEIFKTSSLAEFIIKTLNPNLTKSALQTNLTDPIDAIVFKFYKPGETKTISAKIIDPYNINILHKTKQEKVSLDTNEILLLDVLSYIEQRGISNISLLSTEPDERYIELISNLFNNYIFARGHSILGISIDTAKFVKNNEFNLNTDNITNTTTKKLIEENPEFKSVFQIILGSFRKKRNPSNIITPTVVNSFNSVVDEINEIINKKDDKEFKTFFDYLNIQSSTLNNEI
ncbi:MAG: hypothetical protein IKO36_04465 [Bacteroidaceae bacterium]|nr:hypothetical protein [Bacteroidaceae bacterium]